MGSIVGSEVGELVVGVPEGAEVGLLVGENVVGIAVGVLVGFLVGSGYSPTHNLSGSSSLASLESSTESHN